VLSKIPPRRDNLDFKSKDFFVLLHPILYNICCTYKDKKMVGKDVSVMINHFFCVFEHE